MRLPECSICLYNQEVRVEKALDPEGKSNHPYYIQFIQFLGAKLSCTASQVFDQQQNHGTYGIYCIITSIMELRWARLTNKLEQDSGQGEILVWLEPNIRVERR